MPARTVNYTINTSIGDDWTGSFAVDEDLNTINSELPTNIVSSAGSNFVPAQFESYASNYVTWRSVDISGQASGPPQFLNVYPSSGFSLDIWSSEFRAFVDAGGLWSGLNGASYNLLTAKNTIHYDYSTPNAEAFGSGGTISFTLI